MVNLKKALRSKLEVLEEMKQYGNIKSIKETHERYAYEIHLFLINNPFLTLVSKIV